MPNPRATLKKKICEVLKNINGFNNGDVADELLLLMPKADETGEIAAMQDRVDHLASAIGRLSRDSSLKPMLDEVSERLENLIVVIDAYNEDEVMLYDKVVRGE